MKTRHILYGALAFSALLTSCDEVDKADRYIYVEPATVARHVLIEDFTGQRCINCPKAHEAIEHLQAQYGEENVVAVSIHAGQLAVKGSDDTRFLKTDLGDEYNNYWKIEAWPMGIINRVSGVAAHTDWATYVHNEIQKPTSLKLNVAPSFDPATRELTLNVEGYGLDNVRGKLQLWLVEDHIVANQLMPDGSMNRNYVHNNVFRTAVNGKWGTDFPVAYNETTRETFTTTLKDSWKAEEVSVIAFVYNDAGVVQVIKQKIQ